MNKYIIIKAMEGIGFKELIDSKDIYYLRASIKDYDYAKYVIHAHVSNEAICIYIYHKTNYSGLQYIINSCKIKPSDYKHIFNLINKCMSFINSNCKNCEIDL